MNSKRYTDIHKNRSLQPKKKILVKSCLSQIEESEIKYEPTTPIVKEVSTVSSPQKNSVKRMAKQAIIEWCDETTLHAIPIASRSKNKSNQLLYLFCFLTSAGFGFSYVGRSIITYLRFDTVTYMQVINETPTFFPTVSFCNLKMLNKESSKSYLQNILFDRNNISIINQSKYGDNILNYLKDTQAIAQYSISNDKSSDLRRNIGFELNETMISCTYNWRSCSLEDFTYFYHPLHGSCYSFNQDLPTKTTILSGPLFGLNIEFFMGNKNQTEREFHDGLMLVIHNQTSKPIFNSRRLLVPSGAENDVKITRSYVSKLGGLYSLCVKNEDETFSSEFYDYIVKTLKLTYSQEYCQNLCIQKQIISKCGCASVFLSEYDNSTFCNISDLSCCYNITISILNGYSDVNCDSLCPLECEYIDYNIQLSRATFPTQYYSSLYSKKSKLIASGISNADISTSLLRLNIFYGTTTYTYIGEAAAMDADTLFATIGGFLGLCTGTSILFVVEVLELCITTFNILITKKHQVRGRNLK